MKQRNRNKKQKYRVKIEFVEIPETEAMIKVERVYKILVKGILRHKKIILDNKQKVSIIKL